jgi:hypothetical protein
MMESKYSHYLVQKAYYYSPSEEQKKYFRKQINGSISKLIMFQNASEVIEYIYSQTDQEKDRVQMVHSFYGQYYLLLKTSETTSIENQAQSLQQFIKLKPQLKEQILEKIENIVQKLVEKGMSRHSIVQAIIKDYVV